MNIKIVNKWIMNCKVSSVLILLFQVLTFKYSNAQDFLEVIQEGSPCINRNGHDGTCRKEADCPNIVNGNKICYYDTVMAQSIVCCSEKNTTQQQSEAVKYALRVCQKYYLTSPSDIIAEIISGVVPQPFWETPYLASIGWTDEFGNIKWKCTGSIIERDYLLTAAHCTSMSGIKPDVVRVGDLPIDQYSKVPVIFNVKEVINHPNYQSSGLNDIAILHLEIRSGDESTVTPICIFTENEIPVKSLTSMGYNEHKFSQCKINVVENSRCTGLKDYQFCANIVEIEGNACENNIGSPILFHSNVPNIVGVTNFEESGIPTTRAYTKIAPYIDWIGSVVWSY